MYFSFTLQIIEIAITEIKERTDRIIIKIIRHTKEDIQQVFMDMKLKKTFKTEII